MLADFVPYIIIGLLIFIVILMIIMWLTRLNSEWTGKVVDKNSSMMGTINRGALMTSQNRTITVETKEGKKVVLRGISDGIYNEFNVGDNLVKHKGSFNPVKP